MLQQNGRISGWKLKIINQPLYSPDLNVLYLGFFRTIYYLQQKKSSRNVDNLINAVKEAFNQVSPTTVQKNIVALKEVMLQVILSKCDNDFKIQHSKKFHRIREGEAVEDVYYTESLVEGAK